MNNDSLKNAEDILYLLEKLEIIMEILIIIKKYLPKQAKQELADLKEKIKLN